MDSCYTVDFICDYVPQGESGGQQGPRGVAVAGPLAGAPLDRTPTAAQACRGTFFVLRIVVRPLDGNSWAVR